MFRKVLCPIDFSPESQHAMRLAIRLANEADVELELMHAWSVPAISMPVEAAYPSEAIDALLAGAEKAFAEAIEEAEQLGAKRLTSRFAQGLASDQICHVAAADQQCDLIVMGTHGRTGLSRLLLGSVAEKVVRHAPCSVLAVRGERGTAKFEHVLCPVDFAPSSRLATELAADLVARDGRGLALLHVLELPIAYSGEPTTLDFAPDLDRAGAASLERWATELRAKAGVPIAQRTRIGNPAAQILAVLDKEPSFDLVAVGTHGRTGLSRVFLGSVAEKIVRHAPCPVLVARPRV